MSPKFHSALKHLGEARHSSSQHVALSRMCVENPSTSEEYVTLLETDRQLHTPLQPKILGSTVDHALSAGEGSNGSVMCKWDAAR